MYQTKMSNYKNVPKYVYNLLIQMKCQIATKNNKMIPKVCLLFPKVLKCIHKVSNIPKKVSNGNKKQ